MVTFLYNILLDGVYGYIHVVTRIKTYIYDGSTYIILLSLKNKKETLPSVTTTDEP